MDYDFYSFKGFSFSLLLLWEISKDFKRLPLSRLQGNYSKKYMCPCNSEPDLFHSERLTEMTEVIQKQWGLRREGEIFPIKTLTEYLGKDENLYAGLINLEKAYHRMNREGLWDAFKVHSVWGQLLQGNNDADTGVRMEEELGESFFRNRSEARMCDAPVAI